jgi:hypothetical protein
MMSIIVMMNGILTLTGKFTQAAGNNITKDQSRYVKSIARRYLDTAGIERINSPHNYILPINFIPTIEDKAKSPELSKKIQEAYNIDYDSCIGSLI